MFSDNLAKPTPDMRSFMAEAEVGDDTKGEDPTVNHLQHMVAELLGKEAALFLTTGTLCNEIAFLVHCRPGDEIIMDKMAHPIHYESGGPAALAGATIRPLDGDRGIFTAEQVRAAIRPASRFHPQSRLVSVEQTCMLGGGVCWPLESMEAVASAAKEAGLAAHLDGARLLIASATTNVLPATYAAPFDSVMISLDKGIGAPVGAALAGSEEFIDKALYWKQRLGASWRQPGIIAAACVYALRNHVDRIPELLANAKLLAHLLQDIPGIEVEPVETNIVYLHITKPGLTANRFRDLLLSEHQIRVSVMGPQRPRVCMNLDVSEADVREAASSIRDLLSST
jgi:threonine aldolase